MDLSTITTADFQAYFSRDFPYPPAGVNNDPQYVNPSDITKAFGQAMMLFNQGLFSTNPNITIGYLYLTAHFLVIDMRGAAAGISGAAQFPVNSRSVGSVSESFAVPAEIADDTSLAAYTQTSYGMKYLQMVLPSIRGNIVSVYGGTRP